VVLRKNTRRFGDIETREVDGLFPDDAQRGPVYIFHADYRYTIFGSAKAERLGGRRCAFKDSNGTLFDALREVRGRERAGAENQNAGGGFGLRAETDGREDLRPCAWIGGEDREAGGEGRGAGRGCDSSRGVRHSEEWAKANFNGETPRR
jgi:hypothetical protein